MPLLELEHLFHRFDGIVALQDVSFHVDAGEIVALIGPNASGKTTLFDLIGGRFKPTAGRVLLNGKDVTFWPPHLRSHLGIARTFQIVRPFLDLNALENVVVGATFAGGENDIGQAHNAARRALQRVGMDHCAGIPARHLSLGQLKLLELARALACNPKLLLLDEVGAGLSPAAGADLRTLLLRLRDEGVTILGIEHSPRAVADICDRLYALDRGQIIAEGVPAAVLEDARVIESYLGE